MKKKFEMELLNSEELKNIKGGVDYVAAITTNGTNVAAAKACTKAGDIILKQCVPVVGDIVIKWCITYEAKCSGDKAQFIPCITGDTSTCEPKFTLKPL